MKLFSIPKIGCCTSCPIILRYSITKTFLVASMHYRAEGHKQVRKLQSNYSNIDVTGL